MPRTARASAADYCYHVLNRGNGRAEVFHEPDDYNAFLGMIAEAAGRTPMRVLAYCLMPNHFHLVVRPRGDGDLSRWMQWLLTTHVRRYRRHYGSSGHVWQGRFQAFPCQDDPHLLTVLRYVERNPLRAGLVTRKRGRMSPFLSPGLTPSNHWSQHTRNCVLYCKYAPSRPGSLYAPRELCRGSVPSRRLRKPPQSRAEQTQFRSARVRFATSEPNCLATSEPNCLAPNKANR